MPTMCVAVVVSGHDMKDTRVCNGFLHLLSLAIHTSFQIIAMYLSSEFQQRQACLIR